MHPVEKAKTSTTGALAEWKPTAPVLESFAQLNELLAQDSYSDTDKAKIVQLLKALGLGKSDESKWVVLRQNRGRLLRRSPGKDPVVIAAGRTDWLGWVELKKEPLSDTSILN